MLKIKKFILLTLLLVMTTFIFGLTEPFFDELVENTEKYEQQHFSFTGLIIQRRNADASYTLWTGEGGTTGFRGNLVIVSPRTYKEFLELDRLYGHRDIVQFENVQFIGVYERENIWGEYIPTPYFEYVEISDTTLIKSEN